MSTQGRPEGEHRSAQREGTPVATLDPQQAVVVLLDCQEGVAERVLPDAGRRAEFGNALVALVESANAAGVPVVRVEVGFRAGYVEIAASNAYFSGVKAAGRMVDGSAQTAPMREIASLVAPAPRVVKRRIGALAGTDLEWVVRGLGRSHLVLGGLITRGAVLSTACHAADLDYRVTVVSEVCHDPDPEVHRVLLGAVLPLRASVASLADVRATFAGSAAK